MPAEQQLGLNTLLEQGRGSVATPAPHPIPAHSRLFFNINKKGTFLLWSNRGHFYCGMTRAEQVRAITRPKW